MSPRLRQVVLDTTDARAAAEFYRQLLSLQYVLGDEPPPAGEADPDGADWLVLADVDGRRVLALQQVEALPASTWPQPGVPQQLHLDLVVDSRQELDAAHGTALRLGARLLQDRSEDADEPLRVYADLDGHPFCVFLLQ